MTSENMIKVIEAANSGNYQIVCRAVSGALDAWYITLVDPTDWNWSFNEYRIYVGTKEPPMTDTMNDYSVYFCGYTYYYIDTDGEVKSVTNVNFEENGAQYTSFLRCHEIMTDNITANETGVITLTGKITMPKNVYAKDGGIIDMNNSDIVGANSIVFGDNAGASEGIVFDCTDVSKGYNSIRINSGVPKVRLGASDVSLSDGTDYSLIHSGNISSQSVNYATSSDKSNTSFGLNKFTLTKDDNGGSSCWILLSNISSYYDGSKVTTVSPKLGIQGIVFNNRGSASSYNMTGMTAITCTLAYNSFSLTYRNVAGSTYVIPQVVSYNGAYYLALKLNKSANNVRFVGETYGTIETTQVTSGVTEVTSGVDNEARSIIDIAHPVGSTYIQYPDYPNPSELFAGTTWTTGNPIVYRSSVSGTTANLGTMNIWIRTA